VWLFFRNYSSCDLFLPFLIKYRHHPQGSAVPSMAAGPHWQVQKRALRQFHGRFEDLPPRSGLGKAQKDGMGWAIGGLVSIVCVSP